MQLCFPVLNTESLTQRNIIQLLIKKTKSGTGEMTQKVAEDPSSIAKTQLQLLKTSCNTRFRGSASPAFKGTFINVQKPHT